MKAVDEVRENQGDAQADAVLAAGVNAGVELPMFKKRGNNHHLLLMLQVVILKQLKKFLNIDGNLIQQVWQQ